MCGYSFELCVGIYAAFEKSVSGSSSSNAALATKTVRWQGEALHAETGTAQAVSSETVEPSDDSEAVVLPGRFKSAALSGQPSCTGPGASLPSPSSSPPSSSASQLLSAALASGDSAKPSLAAKLRCPAGTPDSVSGWVTVAEGL